jgi:hypothetical protein
MAYLAEFAVAAAVAAAALVPSAALMRSAALNGAETKCYTVANGLTKAVFEYRNNRHLMERGATGQGLMGFQGLHWGEQPIATLQEQLANDFGALVVDLMIVPSGGGSEAQEAVIQAGAGLGGSRCVLLRDYLVLIEVQSMNINDDWAFVRYSTIKPKPGFGPGILGLGIADGTYTDFTLVKTVGQAWQRRSDGRIVFERPHTLTPNSEQIRP